MPGRPQKGRCLVRMPPRILGKSTSCMPITYESSCRSMDVLELVRVIAETHLATVALCHCVTSGLQVAVKMYHKERLTGKMEKQVLAFKTSSASCMIMKMHHPGASRIEQSSCSAGCLNTWNDMHKGQCRWKGRSCCTLA